jgi:hypothetical protein
LFLGASEIALDFSGPAGDEDFDGVQADGLHPQLELLINFLVSVLLEAIAHG